MGKFIWISHATQKKRHFTEKETLSGKWTLYGQRDTLRTKRHLKEKETLYFACWNFSLKSDIRVYTCNFSLVINFLGMEDPSRNSEYIVKEIKDCMTT